MKRISSFTLACLNRNVFTVGFGLHTTSNLISFYLFKNHVTHPLSHTQPHMHFFLLRLPFITLSEPIHYSRLILIIFCYSFWP